MALGWLVPRMYHACTSHVPGLHLPIPSQLPRLFLACTWLWVALPRLQRWLEWFPNVQKVDTELGREVGHIHRRYTVGTRLMVVVQSLCLRHFLANAEAGALFWAVSGGGRALA